MAASTSAIRAASRCAVSVPSVLCAVLHEYTVPRRGVVHVGAHRAQELKRYSRCGFERTLWIEPNPVLARDLRRRGLDVIECAVLNRSGVATLNITSWDKQSSTLRPLRYRVVNTVDVPCRPMHSIDTSECNVMVVDVQGAELEVLESTADTSWLDVIVVEVNKVKRYDPWTPPEAMIDWCSDRGYRCVREIPHGSTGSIVDYVMVHDRFIKAAYACA